MVVGDGIKQDQGERRATNVKETFSNNRNQG
jgi:hypothetical protein